MKNSFRFLFSALLGISNVNLMLSQWVHTSGPLGLGGADVRAFTINATNLFAGTYGGVFLSTNNGTTWNPLNSGLTDTSVNAITFSSVNLLAGTAYGGVFYSTNNGTNWTAAGQTNSHVWAFLVSDTNLYAGTGGGVYHSTDHGASWTVTALTGTRVNALALSDTNLYAGLDGGGVVRSTNGGTSWTATGLTGRYTHAFALSGTNLFAGTSSGVYRSTNSGTSWTTVDSGLTDTYVNALTVSGANLFAGTANGGVFLSTNNGTSWNGENTGLTSTSVQVLATSGTNLLAGTSGGGVWRRPLSQMTSAERLWTDLPTHYSLAQNYPNPFNPTTTISFSLPSKSFVSLKVFDVRGREVSNLLSEELPAGTHSKQWNAASFASGVYFYRLQAGNYVETKKLVLLR